MVTAIDKVQLPHDPIVEEVRTRGQQLTQRFDHDPKKLFEILDHLALTHPEKMVDQIRESRRSGDWAGENAEVHRVWCLYTQKTCRVHFADHSAQKL